MITLFQYDDKIEFLANLKDIMFSTTDSKVQVTITATSDDSQVYQEILFPSADNTVVISDLSEMLEPFITPADLAETFLVDILEVNNGVRESFHLRVAYGMAETALFGDFVTANFLTVPRFTVRTALGRVERLSLWKYATSGTIENPTAVAHAYYTDGSTMDYALTVKGGANVTPAIPTADSQTDNAQSYYIDIVTDDFAIDGKQLYSFVVQCEDRTQEFSMDSEHLEHDLVMQFRNSFGAMEFIYCNGKKESDAQFERSEAVIHGEYVTLKTRETHFWNAETGVLTEDERLWALELLRSNYVWECRKNSGAWDTWKRVAITEQEAVYDNLPDNMARYTFTYRLSQRNQNIMSSEILPEIFTLHFTSQYE